MAIKMPKEISKIRPLTLPKLRTEYETAFGELVKILNKEKVYCPYCDDFIARTNFYSSDRTVDGLEHFGCKKCITQMATDYDSKSNTYVDNRDKAIHMLQILDLPYIDALWKSTEEAVGADALVFSRYMTMLKSLGHYKGMTYKDSEFGGGSDVDDDGITLNKKTIQAAKKRFGYGYSNEDYMFLENEYQDWATRHECNTKAQEEVFERLACKKLEIYKTSLRGGSTKDLDATYQNLLNTANVAPRQTKGDAISDTQTMGTLIQKWEETRPLPEIDPELQDADKIGLYIDAFFRGHAAKMLGLKNKFSAIYERVMSKYTVKKPTYDEDSDSDELFERIFGSQAMKD